MLQRENNDDGRETPGWEETVLMCTRGRLAKAHSSETPSAKELGLWWLLQTCCIHAWQQIFPGDIHEGIQSLCQEDFGRLVGFDAEAPSRDELVHAKMDTESRRTFPSQEAMSRNYGPRSGQNKVRKHGGGLGVSMG